jgi:serine protease Do
MEPAMPAKFREVLKMSVIIALAFGLGLTLSRAFDLPRAGTAQQQAPAQAPARPASQATRGSAVALPSFADVVERVNSSVVYIETGRRERTQSRQGVPPEFQDFFRRFQQQPRYSQGSGSGFIVSADGYILTNNHVVEDAEQVSVRLLDNRVFPARVVGRDRNTDLAVIKIDATGLPAAELGNSDQARIGDWVLAIGNPLGFTFTVTTGIISAKGRSLQGLYDQDARYQIQDFIQTDAAINPGNSGGPLLDLDGRVIGVNSAIASQTGYYSGYGFAIPINLARRVMSELIRSGRVERAILGINIADVTPEDAAFVGLEQIRGVLVNRFPDGRSPARQAGIQLGDVIVAVNDTTVAHVAQLQQLVGFKRPGETVRVTVVRNENGRRGVRRTFDVRLAPAEEGETARATPSDREQPPETEGRLGVGVEPMTAQLVQRNRIPESQQGLIVTAIEEGGPAWRRLLSASTGNPDVILYVNSVRVRTLEDFQRALRQVPRGEVVQLRVINLSGDAASQQERVVTIRSR